MILALKLSFALCFVAVLIGGIFTLKNFDKWFGLDPSVPSENESAVLLNKSQVIMLWVFSLKVTIMMAIIL